MIGGMLGRIRDWPMIDVVAGIFRTSPVYAALVGALVVAGGALPVALTVATGAAVGAIPAAARSGLESTAGHHLYGALLAFSLVYVAQFVLAYVLSPAGMALGLRFALFVREEVLAATFAPIGTAHLEDPAVADELALIENAEIRQALSRSIVPALCDLLSSRLAGVGQAVILLTFAWWAPAIVLAAGLMTHRWLRREIATFIQANETATMGLRRSVYFRDMAVGAGAAKEVRVFGLGAWTVGRFSDWWRSAIGDVWRERASHRWLVVQVAAAAALAYGVVFYAIGRAALAGHIGLGRVAVYATAAVGMTNLVYGGDTETLVRQGAPVLQRAFRLRRRFAKSSAHHPVPGGGEPHIRLERVDFAYPSSPRLVLAGLDLEIPPGRSLAIVGENGAGKTTLIKLLTRLREPTAGRIMVNGELLTEIDPTAWRSRVAVIFQDFVRYELSLRDNVGFGALRLIDDDDALTGALADSGGGALLNEVGWDAVLSRAYEGGTDLSGGQWQKVALARALAAVRGGARVLVLDEPTANLDVRAEAELFDRFLEITRGLTTILISHRFSSVRRADRICVIEQGRVVEQGSHAELMAMGARYATMFTLQASRFRSTTGE